MYVKLVNQEMVYAPVDFITPTGNIILNFDKSEILMKEHGFKELIDIMPDYYKDTECPVISGYSETEQNITVNYEVKQLEDIEENDENIIKMKNTDTEIQLALAEIYEKLLGGN